jgi:hypothetical protein
MSLTTTSEILTAIGYRLFTDGTAISASTEPSTTECLAWINEVCRELLTVCVETGSEVGRTYASITLADGDPDYLDLQALIFAPAIMTDENGKSFSGWIEKTNVRNPLTLTTEAAKLNYDPSLESEPKEFYLNGVNALVFLPTPDDTYTAIIPYYPYHTDWTATGSGGGVTSGVIFRNTFDNVIIEAVAMRAQNREEYDLSFELKWFSYIRKQARKILYMHI